MAEDSRNQRTTAAALVLQDATGLRACFSPQGRLLSLENRDAAWTFATPGYGWSLQAQGAGQTLVALRPGEIRLPSRSLRVVRLVQAAGNADA